MGEYFLCDPSGNVTLLIPAERETDCSPDRANSLMEREPTAEQAGFLLPGAGCDIRLEMAGGEFCGNASLCAAAVFCESAGLKTGERKTVTLRVSGAPEPLTAVLEKTGEREYRGKIGMPRITDIAPFDPGVPGTEAAVVTAPGITHIILPEAFGIGLAEQRIRSWCAELNAPALGVMLTDETLTRITPLVWVPASDTLFHEHSCASGTAAVGAYLARRAGDTIARGFAEPGGVLSVIADPEGNVTLENGVKLLAVSC